MINAFLGALAANVLVMATAFIVNEIMFRKAVKKRRADAAEAATYIDDLMKKWEEEDEEIARAEAEAVKPKPAAKKTPAKKPVSRKA